MQDVLEGDLRYALTRGALAPRTSAGITVGVARDGDQRVFAFGTAKRDSIYEIGSVTKTFTGLLLAQMIEQGKVELEEPVRKLLPPGAVAKPRRLEITLLSLVTQHSGLPPLPDNLHPVGPPLKNPYADYGARDLYAYLARRGVGRPTEEPFLYSNLGVGLLGQSLADRADTSYEELISAEIIGPLKLRDTGITLSGSQRHRLIQGHSADHFPAGPWQFAAPAGAGALRSTAVDLLVYLRAQLDPQHLAAHLSNTADARTLPDALLLSQKPRADVPGPHGRVLHIAFAWIYDPQTGVYFHDGATGGYSSFVFFNPKANYAGVVLMNTSIGPGQGFAGELGTHISQRFAGKAAIALDN